MNIELSPAQALVLWRMIFCEPELSVQKAKPQVRKPLLLAGVLEETQRPDPKSGRMRKYLVLTDSGWRFAAEHLGAKLNRAPSAGPVLQAVLTKLKRLLTTENLSLADFVNPPEPEAEGSPPGFVNRPETQAERKPRSIRDAYLAFTGGHFNQPMPLHALRRHLSAVSQNDLDAMLVDLLRNGTGVLYPEDNPQRRTPELAAAALRLGGEPKHYLKLER